MSLPDWFARLPTAAKLLLILTAFLLPIGIALTLIGSLGIRQADSALQGRVQDQARIASQAIESLIARNALALRISANGAANLSGTARCEDARQSLEIAPGVVHNFELETADGKPVCSVGDIGATNGLPLAGPGQIRVRVSPVSDGIALRAGVTGGMATAVIPIEEMRSAALRDAPNIRLMLVRDGDRELRLLAPAVGMDPRLSVTEWPIGNGGLIVRIGSSAQRINTLDRLMLLLPVLMWVAAALITWLLVSRLLLRPLKRLERAVVRYDPTEGPMELPRKLGPSREIQELRDAFARSFDRLEQSEREMAGALEGQRRLVREVHHRVKNNLQVVASLLNIHGRTAETGPARAAYAGIGRRVGALSVVHRNHFAEMEENRGIALRPLLSELAAELRAGAPEDARRLAIDLDVDGVHTTQDVAVAVAFLVTEIVEYSMLNCPDEPIDIALRRTSELTARLTLASPVLVPDDEGKPEKVQFERIIGGLAKQLRSSLDRKLGRYSVDLPVFPQT
jgi:two-component sensor histidine kinase